MDLTNPQLYKTLIKIAGEPISGEEITKICGVNNLIKYADLSRFKNIQQLLGDEGAVIILFETKPNFGHWVCLYDATPFSHTKLIYYFDSYGCKPDDELLYVPVEFAREKYISKLLAKANRNGYGIAYNNLPYQTKSDKNLIIATCGRWVAMRLKLKSLSEEQFKKAFFKKQPYLSDLICTYFSLFHLQ